MDAETKKLIIFFLAIGVGLLINLVLKSAKRNRLAEEQLQLDRNLAEGKGIPTKAVTLGATIKAGLALDKQFVKLGKTLHFNSGTEPIAEMGYRFDDLDRLNLAEIISNLLIVEKVDIDVSTTITHVDAVTTNVLAILNDEPEYIIHNVQIATLPKGGVVDAEAIAMEIIRKLSGYSF